MTSAHKGYALLPFLSYKETVKLKAYPIVKFNFLKAISSVMEYKTPWMAHIFCKYAWHCAYITEQNFVKLTGDAFECVCFSLHVSVFTLKFSVFLR